MQRCAGSCAFALASHTLRPWNIVPEGQGIMKDPDGRLYEGWWIMVDHGGSVGLLGLCIQLCPMVRLKKLQ
jgi:hypothetical protein